LLNEDLKPEDVKRIEKMTNAYTQAVQSATTHEGLTAAPAATVQAPEA